MASWQTISKRNLRTAKEVASTDPRSSLSRSYYAAFSALSAVLGGVEGAFPMGWETPRHARLSELILLHGDPRWRDSVERDIRVLYRLRLDADYRSTVELGSVEASKAAKVAQQIIYRVGVLG